MSPSLRPKLEISASLLLCVALAACSTTQTTTTIQHRAGPLQERVRLERPETAPLSASWHQEGTALLGLVSFNDACTTEAVQVVQRARVTETRPNRRYTTAAYLSGAALTLLGVALVAHAQGKSDHVTCGGGGAPREGATCSSEAGAWRELGAISLAGGVGTIVTGLVVQTRKPLVESTDLPSTEQTQVVAGRRSCGSTSNLEGAIVVAELSSGGKWTGAIDARGAVRIELNGASIGRGARARFVLESAVGAPSVLAPGTRLGELELQAGARPARR